MDLLDETDNDLGANHGSLLQSGKLVTKMFQKIQQLIDDKDALVFVLIDEVKICLELVQSEPQKFIYPMHVYRFVSMFPRITSDSFVSLLYVSYSLFRSVSAMTEVVIYFIVNRWRVWQQLGMPARREQSPLTPFEWSTLFSLSWTRSNGQKAKHVSNVQISFPRTYEIGAIFCIHAITLDHYFYCKILPSDFYFVLFVFTFQTFKCRDPDNLQCDRKDWLGVCGPSWHQAVHRTTIWEGHLQHLPLLPRGANEGDQTI